RGQLVERHPGLDLLVPAARPHVDHHAIRALELPVDLAAARTFRAARLRERSGRALEVVDVEADVVDALHGRRAFAEVRGVVATILEDGEIDVAVAQPDTVGAGGGGVETEDITAELGIIDIV